MKTFLSNNEAKYKLIRTIVQGIIGVIIANLDLLIGFVHIDPTIKPFIVAVVMAILSPIMAYLGGEQSAIELTNEEVEESHWVELGDMDEEAK